MQTVEREDLSGIIIKEQARGQEAGRQKRLTGWYTQTQVNNNKTLQSDRVLVKTNQSKKHQADWGKELGTVA